MTAEQVAAAHQADQAALARQTSAAAASLWAQADPDAVAASWAEQLPAATAVLEAGQQLAAAAADPYLEEVADADDLSPEAAGEVDPAAFAGTAADGRSLAPLLYQPAITALTAIQAGVSVREALAVGRVQLDMIVRSEVADAGRVADGVALTAHREYNGYVRVLAPPSCARCAILAGRRYRWNAGFARHPRCDCRHLPARDAGDDLTTDPRAYFRSLSAAEQDRTFGRAGAQAIRDGADIARVVNARRGMYTAGGRRLTREATTRRGRLAGQARGPRLTPEQIYAEAGGNRDAAIRLLRRYGYLRAEIPRARPRTPLAARDEDRFDLWERVRDELQAQLQENTQDEGR